MTPRKVVNLHGTTDMSRICIDFVSYLCYDMGESISFVFRSKIWEYNMCVSAISCLYPGRVLPHARKDGVLRYTMALSGLCSARLTFERVMVNVLNVPAPTLD